MNLYSPEFFVFFLLIFVFFYSVKAKYQQFILFLASSFFILTFSGFFLFYTYLFIIVNYSLGLQVERTENLRYKKIIANSGILLNITALVFFKYINFIVENINVYLKFENTGVIKVHHLLIPIGISYYTFQGISYILQVYRGHENSEKNLLIFSNYILFFPKFLAGPIELSKTFIPQLKKEAVFNYDNVIDGFQQILWGAFKKIVIADRLAMLINGCYADVNHLSGNVLMATFLLQPLHLYCDFSGYTDMALGIGRLFGLQLTNNFNRPFFSTSVSMFWRRWHISLSNWCNEFIFKRLSFKLRKMGIWASTISVFVTFLVIGIWHGPSWKFVILGLLQGIAINYEYFTRKQRMAVSGKVHIKISTFFSRIATYLFFCFTLIFFNAQNLTDAGYFLANLFKNIHLSRIDIVYLTKFDKLLVFISLFVLLFIEYQQELKKNVFTDIALWPRWIKLAFYYSILIIVIYFGSPNKDFVYMQF
jgi:D-alanyl-lipoteichoic acid acyltransferase DltB (MBOAT superfamily)